MNKRKNKLVVISVKKMRKMETINKNKTKLLKKHNHLISLLMIQTNFAFHQENYKF